MTLTHNNTFIMLSVILQSIAFFCYYAECLYAECCYAGCHYAECRGDLKSTYLNVSGFEASNNGS
jgi:hypothetical protein